MYMWYLSNYSMQTLWTSDISIGKVQIHIIISLNEGTNVREESNIKMLSYLRLAVLPRRYVKAAFSFIVAALAVLPFWAHRRAVSLQSGIEFNSLRPAALSRAAGWSIYWQDIACHWVITSVSDYITTAKWKHCHSSEDSPRMGTKIPRVDLRRPWKRENSKRQAVLKHHDIHFL